MDAVFSTPNEHGMISVISGKYALCPSILVSKAGLKDKLAEVASVDGKPPLNSISAIKEWLIVQSGGMS